MCQVGVALHHLDPGYVIVPFDVLYLGGKYSKGEYLGDSRPFVRLIGLLRHFQRHLLVRIHDAGDWFVAQLKG